MPIDYPPGLVDDLVPSVATVVDDMVVGFEDTVREPVVARELPDDFLRIGLWISPATGSR